MSHPPSLPLYPLSKKPFNTGMASINKPSITSSEDSAQNVDSASAVTFDDLLVAVGKTGNRDAFVRLFEYFAPRVKSFLMRGGLSEDMADELAQETMLTAWHRAESYNPGKAKASTWIYTIARNKKIDWLRKKTLP